MFPSKESVPIYNHKHRQCKNTEKTNPLCTFFNNIAQNLKYETFKLRDFIWEKPPTSTEPTKRFKLR